MTQRHSHLDGLRGLAAANVALSHAVVAFDFALYTGAPEQAHGGWEVAASGLPFLLPAAGANASVCVFLVLSGFVLAHAFSHSRLGLAALAAWAGASVQRAMDGVRNARPLASPLHRAGPPSMEPHE